MDTASFRIKFTPLIKDFNKNDSKCCLEIIPEVSSIQNLDKINWQKKSDVIEYTSIPMNYKVILRKKHEVKESCHELEKMYHSCVDLLANSSSTCLSLGAGDNVLRMISDTLINDGLRSMMNSNLTIPKNSNTQLELLTDLNCSKDKQVDSSIVILGKLLDGLSTNDIMSVGYCSTKKIDASTSPVTVKNVDLNKSTNKIICTSCNKIMYNQMKAEYEETVTDTSTCSNKVNYIRKLSVTPIHSIDTIDTHVHQNLPHLVSYPTLTNVRTNELKHQRMFNEPVRIQEILKNNSEKFVDKHISDYYPFKNIACRKRELPEVRVANFIKNMETEIMPLKLMLHEILQKCSNMGLLPNNESSHLKERPVANKQLMKYCISEKQATCNRVVYSIVFEG